MGLPKEFPDYNISYPKIEIGGRSSSEDAGIFWIPFLDELELLLKKWDKLKITFKFDYFNTGAKRYLTVTFNLLESYKYKLPIEIDWYYLKIDTDIEELGMDYKEMCTVTMNVRERS